MQLNLPDSELEHHVHLPLGQLQHPEPTEAEPEGEEDWGWVQVYGGVMN